MLLDCNGLPSCQIDAGCGLCCCGIQKHAFRLHEPIGQDIISLSASFAKFMMNASNLVRTFEGDNRLASSTALFSLILLT